MMHVIGDISLHPSSSFDSVFGAFGEDLRNIAQPWAVWEPVLTAAVSMPFKAHSKTVTLSPINCDVFHALSFMCCSIAIETLHVPPATLFRLARGANVAPHSDPGCCSDPTCRWAQSPEEFVHTTHLLFPQLCPCKPPASTSQTKSLEDGLEPLRCCVVMWRQLCASTFDTVLQKLRCFRPDLIELLHSVVLQQALAYPSPLRLCSTSKTPSTPPVQPATDHLSIKPPSCKAVHPSPNAIGAMKNDGSTSAVLPMPLPPTLIEAFATIAGICPLSIAVNEIVYTLFPPPWPLQKYRQEMLQAVLSLTAQK